MPCAMNFSARCGNPICMSHCRTQNLRGTTFGGGFMGCFFTSTSSFRAFLTVSSMLSLYFFRCASICMADAKPLPISSVIEEANSKAISKSFGYQLRKRLTTRLRSSICMPASMLASLLVSHLRILRNRSFLNDGTGIGPCPFSALSRSRANRIPSLFSKYTDASCMLQRFRNSNVVISLILLESLVRGLVRISAFSTTSLGL
mmetsp:Transcript_5860/g.11090  ORF Transcript_5860/g.11090 Transcript_5860/m.11090 type:complete len:203 (+) Transcript_5860:655-1263(+)